MIVFVFRCRWRQEKFALFNTYSEIIKNTPWKYVKQPPALVVNEKRTQELLSNSKRAQEKTENVSGLLVSITLVAVENVTFELNSVYIHKFICCVYMSDRVFTNY